jgi:hypothetical protein
MIEASPKFWDAMPPMPVQPNKVPPSDAGSDRP